MQRPEAANMRFGSRRISTGGLSLVVCRSLFVSPRSSQTRRDFDEPDKILNTFDTSLTAYDKDESRLDITVSLSRPY